MVLALLALLVFAWIVAGAFFGGPDEEQVSNRAEVAQTQDPPRRSSRPRVEKNRDADSYAAYQFKDPFRQLVAPAETTAATPPPPSGPPADGGSGRRRRWWMVTPVEADWTARTRRRRPGRPEGV
jgi:hypothetical protein